MPPRSQSKRFPRYLSAREIEVITRFVDTHPQIDTYRNISLSLKLNFAALSKELEVVRESDTVPLREVQIARKISSLQKNRRKFEMHQASTNELGKPVNINPTGIEALSNSDEGIVQMDDHRQTVQTSTLYVSQPISTEALPIGGGSISRTNVWSPALSEGDVVTVQSSFAPHRNSILQHYGLDEQRPWQECLYSSWQSYLQREGHALSRSNEPLNSGAVEKDIGKMLSLVKLACTALLEVLPYCWMLNVEPALIDGFMNIMTGKTGQSALNELKGLQACHPSFLRTDLCCALAGAAVYKWAFGEFSSPVRVTNTSNYVTRIMMEFIENECPSLWRDYQNLHRQNQLSSEVGHTISQRATRLTNQLYNLFESSHVSTVQQASNDWMFEKEKLLSESFKTKEIHYHDFLSHMTQAMKIALTLRMNLERCSELNYTFRFPKTKTLFVPSEMQGRENEYCMQTEEHRLIVISLFPSIWTSIEGKENSARMLTKAIVIL